LRSIVHHSCCSSSKSLFFFAPCSFPRAEDDQDDGLPESFYGDGFGFSNEDMARHPLFMESVGSDVEDNAAFEAIQALLLDDPPEGKPQ
jgi:hypothetical protein